MYGNVLYSTFHHTGLSAHLEEGSSWSIDKTRSANWDKGFSAAFNVPVMSPLHCRSGHVTQGSSKGNRGMQACE